jgi:predicted alpha/beta hydrolase family esterase
MVRQTLMFEPADRLSKRPAHRIGIVYCGSRHNLVSARQVILRAETRHRPDIRRLLAHHCDSRQEAKVQFQTISDELKTKPIFETQEPAAVLTVPGLDGSCERHWQSHWEVLPNFRRVELPDWQAPKLHAWVSQLDRSIRETPRPLVLAAHSLGCLAAVWWATKCWSGAFYSKVKGLLLVAPPDVDVETADVRIRDFRPTPDRRLPMKTIVIASQNDPFATFERSSQLARLWGAELIDAGNAGHLNAQSRLGEWSDGLKILARLSGHNPNLLVAEAGLRMALA